jgi:tRNA dimethylallyltransferase
MSAWQQEHQFASPRYQARLIGIGHSKEELALRIDKRARTMFHAGFVDEVRSLLERGYGATRAMGSVGYKQIEAALAEPSFDETELLDSITRATRIFARRQRTWLREQPVTWLEPAAAQGDDVVSVLELG